VYHAKQLVGRFVFKSIARTNDHIIAISENTKREFVEFTGIPEEKVTVIYEASDVQDGGVKKYPLPFKRYIMYVGAQSDYKNIKRLGDAHQKLLQTHPDLGLVLVGKKTAAHLKNEAYFQKKKYQNILFTDFVSDEQLNWLYKHATAYTFPSLMEGFGLPPLEAMGHGLPVVASNASCIPEICGNAAYYFNPLDVNDMVRAIDTVIGDEKLQVRLATTGYKQIKKYSWERMAKQTHKIYLDLLADAKTSR
jgi:glycosyltransferase involved in cell wall biosynthesis